MTDKELLELAAKAAGINLQWMGGPVAVRDGVVITAWNPLFDDGDALRLAVKLEINVLRSAGEAGARHPSIKGWVIEDASRDPYAATRRAIVRAAAEIGKMNSV